MNKITTLRTEVLRKALDFTSKLMRVEPADILGISRERNIVLSRHLTRYFLYDKEGITWTEISRLMNCNHASIIHSIKFIRETAVFDKYINTLKHSVDYNVLPDHFTMREEIKRCLEMYSTPNTKTEGILEVFRKYEEANRKEEMVVREEDSL